MAYNVANPILVLVGAAASNGQRMFAEELFSVELSNSVESLSPLLSEGKFDGLPAVLLCQIVNDRVKNRSIHKRLLK